MRRLRARVVRRVFGKILLWFWGALALVGLALYLAVMTTTTPIEERMHRFSDQAVGDYAQISADVLARGGPGPLAAYLGQLERTTRVRGALFGADGREIAACGEIDRLARDRLGVGLQQALHEDRRPVARPARPAGWISAFALGQTSWFLSFLAAKKYAARGRGLRPRNKKPGAVSRPGVSARFR